MRIRGKVEEESSPEQAGFRQGRGTHNHITSLRILTEKARARQQPLFFCFVDYQQAFDSVCHAKLWKGLRELGFPLHLINLIKSLYENSKSRVRWGRKKTETFIPRRGTRQGCLISPDLFNLMAELLMRIALNGYTEGVKIGGIRLTNLRYADDIILIAGSRSELQNLVGRVQSASTEMGLRINVKKTAVMSLNASEKPEIEIYGERIPIVKTFKYLGVILSEEATGEAEFQARLNQGYAKLAVMKPVLKRKDIPARLKVKLIQALVFPVVMYGCEAWSLSKDENCNLRAFETKAYRRALGIHYGERVSNREVFARAGCEAMIERTVRTRKMRYFGHVVRHDSLENTIMLGMTEGMKRREDSGDSG